MKMNAELQHEIDRATKEEAVMIVNYYRNASIKNVVYIDNPDPKCVVYTADLVNREGELLFSSGLEFCVERLALVAALKVKHNII